MNCRKLTGTILLFLSVLCALAPVALRSSPSPAQSGEGTRAAAERALARIEAAGHAVTAERSPQTGSYNFVRAADGGAIAEADAATSPQRRALSFLSNHGALLGMTDAERAALSVGRAPAAGSDLQIVASDTDALGMTHVRLDQFYQGLRVFGAQVVVHMSAAGITAVNGNYVPDIALRTVPSVTPGAAMQTALAAARKAGGGDKLAPGKSELAVYPAGLLEGAPVRAVLAYAVEVTAAEKREQVWVDAQHGTVLIRIPLHQTALNRRVYSPRYDSSNPDMFVLRKEGDPPTGVIPVDNLYDFTGQTYNFFSSAFGRDSYDGAGQTMRTVYLVNEVCPNAYWNGSTTNYCPEVDADDVVAHEWGHAYTEYTHNLVYAYQSGALNESYSDIWGETIDLNNGVDGEGGGDNSKPTAYTVQNGTYVPSGGGVRWRIGEDVQALNVPAAGILRDMWTPVAFGNPDKVTALEYACDEADAGGVHNNSGVPNHAFAILVDGKSFNGQSVQGIGFVKAIHIYFRAMTTYQTPTSNFVAHANALETSCSDLVGQPLREFSTSSGALGAVSNQTITAGDCEQVKKALLAVEMRTPPKCNFAPLLAKNPPSTCSGATSLFSEDWETGNDGWTLGSDGEFDGWPKFNWEVRGNLPEGHSDHAAFATDPSGGVCGDPNADYSGHFWMDSPEMTVPADTDGVPDAVHVRFDHFVQTESAVDGGNLSVSVNGGAFQLVPQENYVYNPPNVTLREAPPVDQNTNPKAGERAWSGFDTGTGVGSWGTTVVNLSAGSLGLKPGDKIRLRFDFGLDGCGGSLGWLVDSIQVYTCPDLAAPTLTVSAGYENPDTDGAFQLSWTRPPGATGPDTLQESQCGLLLFDDAQSGLAKWEPTTVGSGVEGWRTSTKPQHDSAAFYATGSNGARDAAAILTLKSPLAVPAAGKTLLTFEDWDVNEGDDTVNVEVSDNDGGSWNLVYSHTRSANVAEAELAQLDEPFFSREVDLSAYNGKTIRLRFRYQLGAEDRPSSAPFGWYVDNISLTNENYAEVLTTNGTTAEIVGKARGSYCYRVRTSFTINGQTVPGPYSNVVGVDVGEATVDLPSKLQNISSRLRVLPGDNVLIAGFIVTGSTPKRVIVRGLGPSLGAGPAPVVGSMSDPTLELHDAERLVYANDDWKESQRSDIEATGIAPSDDRESAIVSTLTPGAYTAVLRGKNDEIGIALLEVYDIDAFGTAKLANISTRGFVEVGDNVLIGGFIAGPSNYSITALAVRAIAPSLKASVPTALDDPTLELVDGNGTTLASNDNWKDSQQAEIEAAGLAPSNDAESTILVSTLPPGGYTAVVRGKNNTVGVAVVEIYNLR